MIRVQCAHCGSKLNAKPELAGQTRKCPKCGQPVLIAEPEPQPEAETTPQFEEVPEVVASTGALAAKETAAEHVPERLNRQHRYLICDRTRLIAMWENNGQGWVVKTNSGMAPASRNQDKLPVEGDFRLVELKLEPTPAGHRLRGLICYQLTHRWALRNLARGDDAILKAVEGLHGLGREQKNVVRRALHEQFMGPVWQNAHKVLAFLKSTDYHTAAVG